MIDDIHLLSIRLRLAALGYAGLESNTVEVFIVPPQNPDREVGDEVVPASSVILSM